MPKLPGREPTFRQHELVPGDWLIDYALIYVPGDPKYRCWFCAELFDTYSQTGCRVTLEATWRSEQPTVVDAFQSCSQAIQYA